MGRPKNFTRDAVLEKALPVFWRRGFADTSLQELEKTTGVNKSGLYAEFKDKEDLFVQSLRYYLEEEKTRFGLGVWGATEQKTGLSTGCRQPLDCRDVNIRLCSET